MNPGRTGYEIVNTDGEVNVLLRSLVAVLEEHLSTRQVVIRTAHLESIRGKRMVTIEPHKGYVVIKVLTNEEGAALAASSIVAPGAVQLGEPGFDVSPKAVFGNPIVTQEDSE